MKDKNITEDTQAKLYHKISKCVEDWLTEQNKKGNKPFQSEVVGALDMVKMDVYSIQSAHRILSQELYKIFDKVGNGTFKMDGKSIIIEREIK